MSEPEWTGGRGKVDDSKQYLPDLLGNAIAGGLALLLVGTALFVITNWSFVQSYLPDMTWAANLIPPSTGGP
jgi:hypothetical protein